MTPKEFKAWFDGFTEGISGTPNDKQWDRIKARVAEIDGTQISYPVYIDRYVRPYYGYLPTITCSGSSLAGSATTTSLASAPISGSAVTQWDSVSAMYAVGKAEAEAA